ncbi:MAG: saccharopine dehydrogenase C-terminal domain-containing protein, partial [Gemmatimonadota bacterium]
GFGAKVRCRPLDAAQRGALDALLADGADAVIDLLPVAFMGAVAAAAVRHGAHVVNTMYVSPEVRMLADEARSRGVAILPEFGMDPGIDLVLLGEAVRGFDEVTDVLSYGAGIPEPAAADNPLKYKVSWTFEGVLRAYHRGARVVRDGVAIDVGPDQQFLPEHVHVVEIEDVGRLEAYPNGDALRFLEPLGLDTSRLRNAGRFTLRYPGHCDFWRTIAVLHLLDDAPVTVDGVAVDRKRFLAAALEPQLRYAEGERDLAILKLDVAGTRGGRRQRVVYDLVDRRDLATGLTAMSRLVGFTASIGAQMLGSGAIPRRGLLSPVVDVPWAPFERELASRGIRVVRRESEL